MAKAGNGGMKGAKEIFVRLSAAQKITIGAALIAIGVGAVVLRGSAPKPTLVPLYTDLAAADASSVLDALTSKNVPHSLADSGHTVLVPADKVYDLRVALAAKGLPQSNDGYALLDKQGITTSEFTQRVDYQRALEGELAKTLRSIDGVTNASVRLALPDDSLFVDTPSTPTASVVLTTAASTRLDDETVQAIVHLVAASVKGLKAKDVTVVDSAGTLLSNGTGASGDGVVNATQRTKAEQAVEKTMQTKIAALLAPVAGAPHMSVSVRAVLDLAEKNSTTDIYGSIDPKTGEKLPPVIGQQDVTSETYEGNGAGASTGVLGPDGATVAQPGSSTVKNLKSSNQVTNLPDRTVTQSSDTPGKIDQLHIAVMVDEKAVTDAQAKQLESSIKAATGLDTKRGDTFQLTRIPFVQPATTPTAATPPAVASPFAGPNLMSTVRTGALALVALLAILLGALSARKARRVIATPLALEAAPSENHHQLTTVPGPAGELTGSPMAHAVHSPIPLHGAATLALDPATRELNEAKSMAEQNPAEVANVLRTWLVEDREARR